MHLKEYEKEQTKLQVWLYLKDTKHKRVPQPYIVWDS